MANPDILLKQDRISVVAGDSPSGNDLTEGSDIEVTSAKNDSPGIQLDVDGGTTGAIRVGEAEESADITTGGLTPYEAEITVGRRLTEYETGRGGSVQRESSGGAALIAAYKGTEDTTAGIAHFRDHGQTESSVTIRGDQAMLSLGYSVFERSFEGGADVGPYAVPQTTQRTERVAGAKGEIQFDDGRGTILRILAENGKLKFIGDSRTDNDTAINDAFLVIDPENEEIHTTWQFSTPNNTYP